MSLLSFEGALNRVARNIVDAPTEQVIQCFSAETAHAISRQYGEWCLNNACCSEFDLIQTFISDFADADPKTIVRLAEQWSSLSVTYDSAQSLFTIQG